MLRWLVAAFVAFGLWLTVHAAGAAEPPKICGPVVTGEIEPAPNDPRQTGRITQGFEAGQCGKPVATPRTTQGSYGYEAHTFKNRTEQTCIRVTLTLTSDGGALSAAGYVPSFDPANVTAGFAGGTSNAVVQTTPKQSFSFDAPVLSDFTVVVTETADGAGGKYRLDVAGCGDVLVRQVEPNYGPVRGGTAVTLRGAGFRADAKVAMGGVAATDVVVDDEFTLHATTPAYTGGGASPHAVDVSVTNSDATTTTKAGAFTYYEPQPATIALSADASPSRFGQLVTFTAHVGPDTPQLATGTVEFLRDGTVFGTAILDSKGNAAASLSELDVGRHAIVARYGGDDYHAAQDASANHDVVRADTATALASSKDPASPVEPFTLMATVTPVAPGAGKPAGSVTFKQGTTDLGTVEVDADGRASFTVNPLAVGDYSFTATYAGNASFNASTSLVHVQHVKFTQTSVSVVVSPAGPVAFGTAVSFDAVVIVTGDAIPKGNLTFEDATTTPPTLLGKSVLDAQGRASLKTSTLAAGARSIRVSFEDPDKVFESASSTFVYKINKAPTGVVLTSSKIPGPKNGWVTLTAKVSAVAGGAAVKGNVEFRQDGILLGTVPVGPNGTAVIDSRRLLNSQYTIAAEFKESESFEGSKAQLVLLVGNGGTDAGVDSGYDAGKRDAGQGKPPIYYLDSSDDGCGCHSTGTGAPASGLSLVGASAIALALVRRRRRR
ncbi:Ig-like domain repeat protein [Pendulispora rubella]|uniref:Ig-like domain repeat protein n=1 Tax=Pendulispora rubella TaxID=2741070 RepID=A0ABZ2L113_9BACT